MSLLSIIEDVADEVGITKPTEIVTSTDNNVIQLLSIANREGKALASRYRWTRMLAEATWTIVAAADQGLINSAIVTAGDFDYIMDDTMWNRTTSLPILGSLNPVDWQTLQAFPVTGPYQQYKIEQGKIFIDPAPTSADTAAFHYKTTSWCESSGGTGQARWAADTDVGRLNEELLTLGIIWRWRKRKGLEYAEDFNIYEIQVMDAMARDGGKPRLALNGGIRHRLPGVMVPLGSWSV